MVIPINIGTINFIRYYINNIYIYYTAYNNKNDIIKQNNPVASLNANPNIAYVNNVLLIDGLRDVPFINALNTNAIPIPAPNNPIVAIPAPMYLPANTICILIIYLYPYYIIYTVNNGYIS